MIALLIMSLIVSWRFKSKFKQYSEVMLSNGLAGKEIAEKMLADHGITDVKVISVEGQLTDHYNPQDKTVNLSPDVYHGRSVAAAAVAAHECGHAVQHATAYSWLQFRSAMVPALTVTSKYLTWVFPKWQSPPILIKLPKSLISLPPIYKLPPIAIILSNFSNK